MPKEVVDTFSVGLKYISPIALKKSIVKELWTEFCAWALRSWDNSHLNEMQEKDSSSDPFYLIPVPFKLTGLAKPYKGKPNESILHILKAGWTEFNSLLSNVPNLDRNHCSVEVESKNALEWCFDNDILVKPTDKNLGTTLVSSVWYEQKVSAFILNNKGYTFISKDKAHTLVIQTITRIHALCYDNSTTMNFVGELQ